MKFIHPGVTIIITALSLLLMTTLPSCADDNEVHGEAITFLKQLNGWFADGGPLKDKKLIKLKAIIDNEKDLMDRLHALSKSGGVKAPDPALQATFHAEFKTLMTHLMRPEVYRNKKLRDLLKPVFQ